MKITSIAHQLTPLYKVQTNPLIDVSIFISSNYYYQTTTRWHTSDLLCGG